MQLGRIDVLYEMPDRRKETVALSSQFAQQHAEHELAPQAAYRGALAALTVGDYAAAQRKASDFLANGKYREHALVPDVMFLSAESWLLADGVADRTPQVAKAEPIYRELIAKYPQHPQAPAGRVRVGLASFRRPPPTFNRSSTRFRKAACGPTPPTWPASAAFATKSSRRR